MSVRYPNSPPYVRYVPPVGESKLKKLFSRQINQLRRSGCPEEICKSFSHFMFPVLHKIQQLGVGVGKVPFLPIIPRPYRSLHDQMNARFPGGYQGVTEIVPTMILDTECTADKLYFLIDVDLGTSLRGEPRQRAEKIIKRAGRFPLTGVEIISLALHTKPRLAYDIWALGSAYRSKKNILLLYWSKYK